MKKDIILSGVGGQGILSIATVIGQAALKDGLYMKQAEVRVSRKQIHERCRPHLQGSAEDFEGLTESETIVVE